MGLQSLSDVVVDRILVTLVDRQFAGYLKGPMFFGVFRNGFPGRHFGALGNPFFEGFDLVGMEGRPLIWWRHFAQMHPLNGLNYQGRFGLVYGDCGATSAPF